MVAPEETGPLRLSAEEQELLLAELGALLPSLEGERRQTYRALAEALTQGCILPEALPWLESVVTLALGTGRARRLYRAEGERVLTELLRRLPRGRELHRSLQEVNRALQVLKGQALQGIRIGMRTLGHYTVTVETATTTITLALRADGVIVESVAVGTG